MPVSPSCCLDLHISIWRQGVVSSQCSDEVVAALGGGGELPLVVGAEGAAFASARGPALSEEVVLGGFVTLLVRYQWSGGFMSRSRRIWRLRLQWRLEVLFCGDESGNEGDGVISIL